MQRNRSERGRGKEGCALGIISRSEFYRAHFAGNYPKNMLRRGIRTHRFYRSKRVALCSGVALQRT